MDKRPLGVVFCLFVALCLGIGGRIAFAQVESDWTDGSSSYTAVMNDSVSRLQGVILPPQAGVRVVFLDEQTTVVAEAITDQDGFFELVELVSYETVELRNSSGRVLEIESQRVGQTGRVLNHAIEYVAVTTSAADRAAVRTTTTITGRVTAADTGLPLRVSVYAYEDPDGFYSDVDFADENGVYELSVLSDTGYKIYFSSLNDESTSYAGEWYDDQPTSETAQDVTPSETGLTDINAELSVGGGISGRVTAESDGTPIEDVSVYIYQKDEAGEYEYVAFASSDENGNYSEQTLQTGDYYVEFDPDSQDNYVGEYYDNQPSIALATPIAVVLGETTADVDAVLTTGAVLRGNVTAAQSGDSLSNMLVEVYTSTVATDNLALDYTDFDGNFEIIGLPAGTYYLKATPRFSSPYLDGFYGGGATLAEATAVVVSAGETAENLDISVETGGVITGIVTADDTAAPMEDARVYVYTSTLDSNSLDSDWSEVDGSYSFTGLPAGTYYLRFEPSFQDDDIYVGEYHEAKMVLADADPIDVTLAMTTTVSATLDRGGVLAGTLTSPDASEPISGTRVIAYEATSGDWVGSDTVIADGQYEIGGLEGGSYYLLFDPPFGSNRLEEYYDGALSEEEATAVSVTRKNTTVTDYTLRKAGTIEGVVTAADTGLPLERIYVALYAETECGYTEFVTWRYTNEAGQYSFTGLAPNTYDVSINGFFDQEYLGGFSSDIELAVGQTFEENAALTKGGIITGRVVSAEDGEALENVRVRFYAYNETFGSYFQFQSVLTDENGAYRSRALFTEQYHIAFETSGNTTGMHLDGYHGGAADLDSVTPVSVEVGEEVSAGESELAVGGQIGGAVTAADTGQPLNDVRVEIYTAVQDTLADITFTNAQGVYTSTAVVAGSYYIKYETPTASDFYEASNYGYAYSGGGGTPAEATALNVTVGNQTTADMVLEVGGRISGQLSLDDMVQEAVNVLVEVYDSTGRYTGYAYTNSSGAYTVYGLRSGTYYVLFGDESVRVSEPANECESAEFETYVGAFYGQVNNFANATAVTVTAGATTGDIDGVLSKSNAEPTFGETVVYLPLLMR